MRKMKKIVSVMLTVFLLLTALPLTAFAEDETAAPLVISENGSYTIDESHDSATPIDITAEKAPVTDEAVKNLLKKYSRLT